MWLPRISTRTDCNVTVLLKPMSSSGNATPKAGPSVDQIHRCLIQSLKYSSEDSSYRERWRVWSTSTSLLNHFPKQMTVECLVGANSQLLMTCTSETLPHVANENKSKPKSTSWCLAAINLIINVHSHLDRTSFKYQQYIAGGGEQFSLKRTQ